MNSLSAGSPARTGTALWFAGARPRTLGVGAVPVAVGTAAAVHPNVLATAAALIVSLGLQVGANYANDYFDGVRGVDRPSRVGPVRLVASGGARPGAVLGAALVSLGLAGATGVRLALATGQERLLAIGAAALIAALLYTGGPRPYAAIAGMADLAVFAFFGLAATVGTAAVQGGVVAPRAWWAATPVGLLAVAVLVANNLRDVRTDAAAGRRTLVVQLGEAHGRLYYQAVVVAALVIPLVGAVTGSLPVAGLALILVWPVAVRPLRIIRAGQGRGLVPAMVATARLHLAMGLGLTIVLGAFGHR